MTFNIANLSLWGLPFGDPTANMGSKKDPTRTFVEFFVTARINIFFKIHKLSMTSKNISLFPDLFWDLPAIRNDFSNCRQTPEQACLPARQVRGLSPYFFTSLVAAMTCWLS